MDDWFDNLSKDTQSTEAEKREAVPEESPAETADSSADSTSAAKTASAGQQAPAVQDQPIFDNTSPAQPSAAAAESTESAPYSYGVYTPQQAYTPQPRQPQGYASAQPYGSQVYTPAQPYAAYGYGGANAAHEGTPAYPSYDAAGQQQYPQQTAPDSPPPKNTNTHKTGRTVFISVICLCVVAACVLIAAYFHGNGGSSLSGTTEAGDVATTGSSGNSDNTGNASVTISSTPTVTGSATDVLTASEIYEKVKDINVGVLVYSNNNLAGEGSGVIMGEDSNGKYTYIITCAHVISDSGISVRVRFNDNTDIEAVIVGYDTKTDIGVLKVKKTGLSAAEFGDISKVSVGQTVYAIGNPGGTEFFGSFTTGMISAMDRPVDSSVGYSQPCIQHTAAINPGNSGGALVNEYGQVIGINSSKIADTDYEGMGFSVPVDTMKKVVDEIIAHGYVTNRPKLGIKYTAVSESQIYSIIVQSNGLPSGSIIIAEIDSDSDLASKGVQVNDLIIKANGKELTSSNTLPSMIDDMSVGDTLTLTLVRVNNNYSIGKPFTVKVKLVEDKGSTTSESETTTSYYFDPFG